MRRNISGTKLDDVVLLAGEARALELALIMLGVELLRVQTKRYGSDVTEISAARMEYPVHVTITRR